MSERKPYFPFFMDIAGAKGLIIGGGRRAYQKINRMLPYGPEITVIAPEVLPEIEKIEGIRLIKRDFLEEDLEMEPDFVVVADGDKEQKRFISSYCEERRIPVNVVDDAPYCSYIYPALISQGDLSIGISTGGKSPTVTSILKERMLELIPDNIEDILDWLEGLRPMMKRRFPMERERAKAFRKIAEECMERKDVLTDEEVEHIIKCLGDK